MLFETAAPAIFINDDSRLYYIMGYLNTWIAREIIIAFNPTFNTNVKDITLQPIIWGEKQENLEIVESVKKCIQVSKDDWNSFETSSNFEKHPLLNDLSSIERAFANWETLCEERNRIINREEKRINDYFTELYSLNECDMDSSPTNAELSNADLGRDIRSLISYAVGCIFGRYSLDKPSLAYAGGDWNPDQYHTFTPDADNVIPITDEEYFTDDLTGLFVAWVKKVFGAGSLEDNLAFIAKALGTKGTSPRAVIRNYFLNGFYADHVKIYQKRPIYWLYDSGKQNGFKALIYMHRYNADTSGLVRADYLYKMEQVYESEIARMDDAIAHGASREVAQATKRKEKLVKQLKECKDYDDRLGHIALARIPIDLDDGVKVNYDKVQTGADGKKLAILAKI